MPVSNKSICQIPVDCRALSMGYTSLLMAYRAHMRCNGMHISFKEAPISNAPISCVQKKKSHNKEQKIDTTF